MRELRRVCSAVPHPHDGCRLSTCADSSRISHARFDMTMFTTFITAALALRRKKEAHKRLMLLAWVSIMGAPAARLPGVLPLGPFAFYGIAFAALAVSREMDPAEL